MQKDAPKKKILIITLLLIIVLLLIDQVSKYIVVNNIKTEIILIENILSIKLVENTGMAFGINSESNKNNIIASIIVLIFIVRFMITKKEMITQYVRVLLSFIIAGGIGNVIDRVIHGAVIDFINLKNMPTFNIADIYIVVGWILFIISVIFYSFGKNPEEKNIKKENNES